MPQEEPNAYAWKNAKKNAPAYTMRPKTPCIGGGLGEKATSATTSGPLAEQFDNSKEKITFSFSIGEKLPLRDPNYSTRKYPSPAHYYENINDISTVCMNHPTICLPRKPFIEKADKTPMGFQVAHDPVVCSVVMAQKMKTPGPQYQWDMDVNKNKAPVWTCGPRIPIKVANWATAPMQDMTGFTCHGPKSTSGGLMLGRSKYDPKTLKTPGPGAYAYKTDVDGSKPTARRACFGTASRFPVSKPTP